MGSKIEEIISGKVEQEYERQLEYLQSQARQSCVELKSCYETTLETLKNLKLMDATIFDFFEKTSGNIRIINHISTYPDNLNVRTEDHGNLILDGNTIRLKENIKYKIIVMAIAEEKQDK